MKWYRNTTAAILVTMFALGGCGYDAGTGYTPPLDVSVSIEGLPGTLAAGDIAPVQVRVQDVQGNDIPNPSVTLASSDPAVALVDGAGRVRAVAAGTATIRASFAGTVGTASVAVTDGPAIFRLQQFGGGSVPLFLEGDSVAIDNNTAVEYRELYLDSGTLMLSGGPHPGYRTTVRLASYAVNTDGAGQRHLVPRAAHDVTDQGSVSYDARGDLTLTSLLPDLTESASAETGGFKLLYRFSASDNAPTETFFLR